MNTAHYKVLNIHDYPDKADPFEKYLNDVEEVYSTIEEVFGGPCNYSPIVITLNASGNWSYSGSGKVDIDATDEVIQKKFPENLWGCVIHESLHAFMQPIIYRPEGANELDNSCVDDHGKEVFTLVFQTVFYRCLREKGILGSDLLLLFIAKVKDEVGYDIEDCRTLYDYYTEVFSSNKGLFAKFIEILSSSPGPRIRKINFWDDLKQVVAEMKLY